MSIDVVLTNLVPTRRCAAPAGPMSRSCWSASPTASRAISASTAQEVRRRSFVRAEQMPYMTGMKARDGSPISYDSGDYVAALDLALDKIDAAGFEARRAEARATRQAARPRHRLLRRGHRPRPVRGRVRAR